MEPVIDLEEAVGSYLNCLSTGCAAGSKLYTSVGKIIDEKFHEIFQDQEPHDKYLKSSFQLLQTQNAFEGYQKALLECKEKLLEILIDSHTKKHQPNKDSKNKQDKSSQEQQYASIALRVAKELYCYHQTVADVLKPLLFSDFQEDFDNVMLTGIEGKDQIVAAWLSVSEANKSLRHGDGLSSQEMGQILSWQHGEDVSESIRKKLNQKISNLIQLYVDKLFCNAVCEVNIPTAFNTYPDELQKVLQNCCSPAESYAASSQGIPVIKEEIEVMLHRELPRVCLNLNGDVYERANPGKAFENTTQKLRAVRDVITKVIESKKIVATKEQVDMFCLRILAASSYSISSALSRTAVIMAFGKANLLQVKPLINPDVDKVVHLDVNENGIEIDVPSKWCIVEDSGLFKSLCRDKTTQSVATVDVSYHAVVNVEEYLVKRIEPVPVVRITQCVLRLPPSNQVKKDQGRERSKSIKVKLTKATTKFFQRKSILKTDSEADIIMNEYAKDVEEDISLDQKSSAYTTSDSEDENQPVPPPRHKRKAKKSKKVKSDSPIKGQERKSQEKKKEDFAWFSSSPRFGLPPPPTLSGSKDQSPSIASFEELQGVIDFLSGSSSSSLALNEKSEKSRNKVHKRNNSMTNLTSDSKNSKVTTEGKLKLCHKKSASFSGNTAEMTAKEEKTSSIEELASDKSKPKEKEEGKETDDVSSLVETCSPPQKSESPDAAIFDLNVERTPGDGIDNRVVTKATFNSVVNVSSKDGDDNVQDAPEVHEQQQEMVTQQKQNDEKPAGEVELSTQQADPLLVSSEQQDEVAKNTQQENNSGTTDCKLQNQPCVITDGKLQNRPCVTTDGKLQHRPCVSSVDIKTDSAQVVTLKQTSTPDLAKSEPNNLHTMGSERVFSMPPTSIAVPNTDNQSKPINPLRNTLDSTQPLSTSFKAPLNENVTSSNIFQPDQTYKNNTIIIPSPVSTVISDSSFPLETRELMLQSKQHTLYEPFNSRLSWPVGLGNKFGSLWSDATLESEGAVVNNQSIQQENKQNETQFTLDKQQDFQKLLEGSKFFTGFRNVNENWKDRSYMSEQRNMFDGAPDTYPSPYERPTQDPWPLQSNMQQRNYAPFPHTNSYNSSSSRNIDNLHLPANPAGPYMRQNREQLLAKQQILEQYARQQKQLQKQAMSQQTMSNPLQSNASGFNNYRMGSNNRSFNLDRVASLPPGMNLGNNGPSRYEILPDRPSLHRSLSNQRSVPPPMHFGNGLSGMQSRSVSDIRLDSAGMLQERMPFSQMSEHNLFLDQYNQNSDLFSSQY